MWTPRAVAEFRGLPPGNPPLRGRWIAPADRLVSSPAPPALGRDSLLTSARGGAGGGAANGQCAASVLVALYVRRQIKGRQLARYERHLMECSTCLDQIEAWQEWAAGLRGGALARRRRRNRGRIA